MGDKMVKKNALEVTSVVFRTVRTSEGKMPGWVSSERITVFRKIHAGQHCGFQTFGVEEVGFHGHGTVYARITLLMVCCIQMSTTESTGLIT